MEKEHKLLNQQEKNGFSRREFIKLCSGTVAGLGISQVFNPALVAAMKKAVKNHPVLWVQGQSCTGCSVSVLNSVDPSIKQVILEIISLDFLPTVMVSEGEMAMDYMYRIANEYKGKFTLVVEGAIPMAADGKYCIVGETKDGNGNHKEVTMLDAIVDLGNKAGSVLAIGTCASYGGIPAAKGNVTGATGVGNVFKKNGIKTPLINIPGCPAHPDWIVGTIAYLLTQNAIPELDADGRPKIFFGKNIHENCTYLSYYDEDEFCKTLSQEKGCRVKVGCKGMNSYADCYSRKWNSGVNWCIENAVCIGCVEPGFPDEMSPFYVGIE